MHKVFTLKRLFLFLSLALMALAINCQTSFAEDAEDTAQQSFRDRILEAKEQSGSNADNQHSTPLGKAVSNMSQGLLSIVAVFLLGASLYKKFGPQKKATSVDTISVIARKNLSPRSSLVVVSLYGRRLLLAQNTENVSLITDLTEFDAHFDSDLSAQLTDHTSGNQKPTTAFVVNQI